MKYALLFDDIHSDAWQLTIDDEHVELESRLVIAKPFGERKVEVPITVFEGRPVDIAVGNMSVPVISARAVRVLEEYIWDDVEILSATLSSGHTDYYVLNILGQVSSLKDRTGQKTGIKDPEFDKGMVADGQAKIGRLKTSVTDILVSESFRFACRRAGLTGAIFLDPRTMREVE